MDRDFAHEQWADEYLISRIHDYGSDVFEAIHEF
jgi:hypothetical protein